MAEASPSVTSPRDEPESPGAEIRIFLIADVRGYTRFTQERGDEAAARLASKFAAVSRRAVEGSGGSVIELRGDEALAVFTPPAGRSAPRSSSRHASWKRPRRSPPSPSSSGSGWTRVRPSPSRAATAAPRSTLRRDSARWRLRARYWPPRRSSTWPVASTACASSTRVPPPQRDLSPGPRRQGRRRDGQPLQGPSGVRGGGRAGLLRPRDPHAADPRPAGRARRAVAVPRGGRPKRERQVLGGQGGRGARPPSWRPPWSASVPRGRDGPGRAAIKELTAALGRLTETDAPALEELRSGQGDLRSVVDQLLPPDGELVLVIDQFEELFTLVEEEPFRARFLDLVENAVRAPDSRLRVIVTMRADFYDRPLLYKRFGDLVGARTQTVTPLSAEELERAISGPAERAGVVLEPGLVAQMIADVGGEPGALPLLQYALTELFEQRRGSTMTLDAYRAIGGVSGALARSADSVYGGLDEDQKEVARQLFLRLTATVEETELARRRVPRSELLSVDAGSTAMESAIEALGAARLLSFDRDPATGSPTVEVAHEALLREWGRLRGWLDAAREDLRTQRRFAAAAREWVDADRDPSFLASGSRLAAFEAWQQGSGLAMTPGEREFLEASAAERDRRRAEEEAREARERGLERRSLRRLRTLVAVLTAAAVIAGALTVFAFTQRGRAEREERVAVARELAAAAVANLEADPERSILLALEAIDRTRSVDGSVLPEAEEALHRAVLASRIELSVPGLGGSVDWSPRGVFVTEGPEDTGMIDIRDAATGERVLQYKGHDIDINDVAFSPDGSMLATGGDDGALKVWDATTGDLISSVAGEGPVWGPSFSADGSRLSASWQDEGAVRIIDPASGRLIQEVGALAAPFKTALSPDGRRVVVGQNFSEIAVVLDVGSGGTVQTLRGHRYGVTGVSWSPDGQWIATAGADASVRIWNPETGETVFELISHTGIALTTDWSPDSRRLLTSGSDGMVKVWEVENDGARELMSLSGLRTSSGVLAAFSPDGNRVITGAFDISAVNVWDVSISGDAEITNVPTEFLAPVGVAFLSDGRIAAPIDRGSVAIWDQAGRRIRTIGPYPGSSNRISGVVEPVVYLAASPDGSFLATARNFTAVVDVWDPATGDHLLEANPGGEIAGLDWSDDGEHLAVASYEGYATIFDRTGNRAALLNEGEGLLIERVAFSPDGRLVATAAPSDERPLSARLSLWDWEGEFVVLRIPQPNGIGAISFDPTGELVAAAHGDGEIEIYDVESGESVLKLPAPAGPVSELAFSPDGSRIVAAGEDGTVRLFDTESGQQELVLRGHSYLVSGVAFSPDGTKVASASPDGTVRVWALDLDDLIRIAEEEPTRELTEAECRQYLHGPCPE